MPAPLNVNREAVKTLALAIGVRQAAREMGLAESTVQAWSNRGKWFSDTAATAPVIRGQRSVQPRATKAPSLAMSDTLAKLGETSRVHLARAGAKASKHQAKLPGAAVTRASGDLKNVVQANAALHGWEAKSGPAAAVMVNVALLGVEPGAVEVSADVS